MNGAHYWADSEDDVVHADGASGLFALCGDSLLGEDEDRPMVATTRRITCGRCIRAIDACKKINDKEIDRRAYG